MSTDAYIVLTFAMATLALIVALSSKVQRQITVVRLVQPPLLPLATQADDSKTLSDVKLPFEEVSHV